LKYGKTGDRVKKNINFVHKLKSLLYPLHI
jgi:hypothetical protein